MKQQPTYGKAAKEHAIKLREISGFSFPEIEEATGIPAAYVRKLMFEQRKKVTPETATVTQTVTAETPDVTYDETTVTAQVTDGKLPENMTKNGFWVTVTAVTFAFFRRHFSRMDFVFYTATVTACYSFWHVSPGIPGVTFAALYWLLAFDALQRCKDAGQNEALARSASYRIWGLELFAAVAHWNLINGYLWRNLDKLPFEVKAVPKGGMWVLDYAGNKTNIVWQNGEGVAIVAAVLSAAICAAVIVAVDTTFKANKIKK